LDQKTNSPHTAAAECRKHGFAKITLNGGIDADLIELEELLSLLGEPITVFRRHPFWKPLTADLSRPSTRSGGTGLNSLHIDCVNVEHPPDFVAFYCVRPDPLGGGCTILSLLDGVEDLLTSSAATALSNPIYSDGAAYELAHVGEDVNPFPVLSSNGWRWRYTGRLLEDNATPSNTPEYDALLEFDRIMMSRVVTLRLTAGDALIVDQRRVLHGRLPLAAHQKNVPIEDRRLFIQAYCKDEKGMF
jgi:hypothetical protein